MADERPGGGRTSAPDPEIHDDDELADALAAELDHLAATGAVPVVRLPASPPDPPAAAQPAEPAAAPAPRAAGGQRPARVEADRPRPVVRPQSPVRPQPAARAQPRSSAPLPPPSAERRSESRIPVARHARAAAPVVAEPAVPHPSHRASAHGARPAAPVDPAPAEPILPPAREVAPADQGQPDPAPRTGAHAAVEAVRPEHPLEATGPLPIPAPLYEAWEQSLRRIGRPSNDDDDYDDDFPDSDQWQPVDDDDAPTIRLARASLGPLPPDPLPDGAAASAQSAAAVEVSLPPAPAEDPRPAPDPPQGPAPTGWGHQRRMRRQAAAVSTEGASPRPLAVDRPEPTSAVAGLVPAGTAADDDEGIDDVAADIPSVPATDTAAIALPPLLESQALPPRGVPVPVSGAEGGTSAALLALLWTGGFATPLALLVGFALATSGAGPAGPIAAVIGAALGIPAAARLGAAAVVGRTGTAGVAARVLGRPGIVAALLLLAARLVAAVLTLLAVADIAVAFTARTLVGADPRTGGVVAVLIAGLLALAVGVLPGRLGNGLLLTLGGLGLIGTLVVLTVFASTGDGVGSRATGEGIVAAGAAGFTLVALLLAATAPDLAAAGTARGAARGPVVALAVSGGVGALMLAAGVSIGVRAGGAGAPGTAFIGALADATSASVTGPLAAIMLLASVTLPALLFRSAGVGAAALLPGRSASLGAAAIGLLAIALALAALAAGLGLVQASAAVGPVIAVPVAVWAGVATAASLRTPGVRSRSTTGFAATVAVLLGWLLTDGLGTPGAQSVLLDALGIPYSSAWRGSPAFGLAAAFVFGIVAALIGRFSARRDSAPALSRMRTEHLQPVDSVGE